MSLTVGGISVVLLFIVAENTSHIHISETDLRFREYAREELGQRAVEYMKNRYKISRGLFDIADKISKCQMTENKVIKEKLLLL